MRASATPSVVILFEIDHVVLSLSLLFALRDVDHLLYFDELHGIKSGLFVTDEN